MRLPLNTTGQLLPLTTAATPYTVFDMASIPANSRSYALAVTLYAFASNVTDPALDLDLEVYDVGLEASPQLIQLIDDTITLAEGQRILKLLDRFPMRGAGRITVQSALDFAVLPVHVYGYVELVGVQELPTNFRPFEPVLGRVGNNQTPFTYLPAAIAAGAGGTATVHQLDPDTPHLVNMFTMAVSGGGGASNGGTLTVVDGSTSQTISFLGNNLHIFDDIPFLPVDSTVGGLNPGFYLSTIDATDSSAAWGSFARG